MAYYYQYYMPNLNNLLYYDIPLFLLFFGATLLIVRSVFRAKDPAIGFGVSAFSAALAYFIVRSEEALYTYIMRNFYDVASTVAILLVAFILVYITLRML